MTIQIVVRHMNLSCDIKECARELCEEVMQYWPDIMRIRIVLDDINGPNKAGIDKRCHLIVRGRHHLRFDIDEHCDDIWQSLHTAFKRLKKKLMQHRRLAGVENMDLSELLAMENNVVQINRNEPECEEDKHTLDSF